MHRSHIDAILELLRSYLRYGRNGPCFIRFRNRLVTQTCQNVEKYHRNGLSGALQGVPCPNWGSAMGWPSPCVCGARPWPTHMAELPCWGARGSARRCRFALLSVFPWFSGLFSKHRSRIDVILEPLRSSLRYGRNGPCFVGFRGRLTLQTPRNVEGYRDNGLSETQKGVPCPNWGSAMGWPSPCVCEARPWPTHMAELPCWGARGSARRRRFALLSVFPWFSGLFSKHRNRMNVILEPLRSYLRYGHNGSCVVGFRGRLTLHTPRTDEGYRKNELSGTQQGVPCPFWGSAMGWPSPCVCRSRPFPFHMAALSCLWALSLHVALPISLLSVFPWFSGLFSKHRSRMNVILEPLRSYLRYGHNGSCFVGFRGRLTLQTPRNVEGCRGNGLSGTQEGVPCLHRGSAMGWPSLCVCGARPWPTHMAELPCWGARGSARRRLFVVRSSFSIDRLVFAFEISSRHGHVALVENLSRGRFLRDEGVASCCS